MKECGWEGRREREGGRERERGREGEGEREMRDERTGERREKKLKVMDRVNKEGEGVSGIEKWVMLQFSEGRNISNPIYSPVRMV